jgi:DNA-binding MarR family transcriptional regulator
MASRKRTATRDPEKTSVDYNPPGEHHDLAEALFWQQPRFTRWALAQVPRWAAPYQISLQQMVILHLVRTEGLTLADLSRRLRVAATVITGLVDRLERQRLIRRQPHPTDRRINQLVLTDEGEALGLQLEKAAISAVARELEAFTAQERATLSAYAELLDRLIAQLVAARGPATTRGARRSEW